MHELKFIPLKEFQKIMRIKDVFLRCQLLADALRVNVLYMIRYAGSGHPGTCFSAIDIMTWLYFKEMESGDLFFSSKGHDVPALYSILMAKKKLPFSNIHKLRRLGGLPGHPDIATPGITTNTGSLGMGVSKAHGMTLANNLKHKKGRVYVLTGDGELQEGQIWESLGSIVNSQISQITAIVDHNKIQSDLRVKDTSNLGGIEKKFESFGWKVFRCDGHNFKEFAKTLNSAKRIKNRPQVIIADTKKGKGVSFMEKMGDDGLYKFHSGAPSMEQYNGALGEILKRINSSMASLGNEEIMLETSTVEIKAPPPNAMKLNVAYGDELAKIGKERKDIVALDADLVLDTGLIPFKKNFPNRYLECGIAEQDMVSLAGGLALRGVLPVVHSFACFLSTRSNEQIYNNATEKTKIIYTASLAGLLPATTGHSHQSVRDISAVGSVPGLFMIEPSCEEETRMAIRWAVFENKESTYIRICNIPAEVSYVLPDDYKLELGKGVILKEGTDVLIIGYGPVMLEQGMRARDVLGSQNISVAVMNLPWLNYVNEDWLGEVIKPFKLVVTLDDSYTKLGQGDVVTSSIGRKSPSHPKIISMGVEEIPASGQNGEVLQYHKLDSDSIAKRIATSLS